LRGERAYAITLSVLVIAFVRPILEFAEGSLLRHNNESIKSHIRENAIQLFQQADIAVALHCLIQLNLMHDAVQESFSLVSSGEVGRLFDTLIPLLGLYRSYIERFDLLLEILSKPELRSILVNFERHKLCRGQPMDGFFKLPKGRLTYYSTRLTSILDSTEESHPDYPSLQHSLEMLHATIADVNSSKGRRRNVDDLLRVQSQLVPTNFSFINRLIVHGSDPTAHWQSVLNVLSLGSAKPVPNLIRKSRVLLKEGRLVKVSTRKRPARCMFWLFSDILVYGHIVSKTQFRVRRVLRLSDTVAIASDDHPSPPPKPRRKVEGGSVEAVLFAWGEETPNPFFNHNAQSFKVRSSSKSFVVVAESVASKHEWVNTINSAVQLTLGAPPPDPHSLYAPVLYPLRLARVCMSCNMKRVSKIFPSRCHCHICGSAICSTCSEWKDLPGGIRNRTCKPCAQALPHAIEDGPASRSVSEPPETLNFTYT